MQDSLLISKYIYDHIAYILTYVVNASVMHAVYHGFVKDVRSANSAFHPYGVDISSTNLPGWGEGGACHLCRVADITLCDPIDKWRPVVLR